MSTMRVIETAIPGPLLIEPQVNGDSRGFFLESWNARVFESRGIDVQFVQDNHSRSAAGVLRGLHYQLAKPQGKLVRVTAGAVFDVAVDMRRSSGTFGRWVGVELTAENHRMFWVPPGFAHGFLALADGTDFLYKCTDYYDPEDERAIAWNDPVIAVDWPLNGTTPTLSARDQSAARLGDAEVYS